MKPFIPLSDADFLIGNNTVNKVALRDKYIYHMILLMGVMLVLLLCPPIPTKPEKKHNNVKT
jgi:hypothetical protein